MTAGERLAILRAARTIAVVGASNNPARASNFVLTYLLSSSAGYEVWPVTPNETEVMGLKAYPSLADLPGKPDMVFPKWKAALFVHGCFWHGHNCHLFKWPSSRPEFWRSTCGVAR